MEELDELLASGTISPEMLEELTNGKDPYHDYERSGELHEDIAEHVGAENQ